MKIQNSVDGKKLAYPDRKVEDRGYKFVCYVDEIIINVKTANEVERVKRIIGKFLEKKFKFYHESVPSNDIIP